MRTLELHKNSCDQMCHLFLREISSFGQQRIVCWPPRSLRGVRVPVSVFCKLENTTQVYEIRMSSSPRGPRFHVPLCVFSPLCPSNVAFPTEFNTSCPFPASPYYRENWHPGPCPLCQLAKSLEGRCSISDITTKISLGFLRKALPCPFVQGS